MAGFANWHFFSNTEALSFLKCHNRYLKNWQSDLSSFIFSLVFLLISSLVLSWRRSLSCRNQCIAQQINRIVAYDRKHRHKMVSNCVVFLVYLLNKIHMKYIFHKLRMTVFHDQKTFSINFIPYYTNINQYINSMRL